MKLETALRLPGTALVEVALGHAPHPPPLLGYGQVPAPFELIVELAQLAPAPFRDRLPQHPELPGPGLPADVREAQEVERLRLAEPPGLPVPDGEPSELDQPGLLGL